MAIPQLSFCTLLLSDRPDNGNSYAIHQKLLSVPQTTEEFERYELYFTHLFRSGCSFHLHVDLLSLDLTGVPWTTILEYLFKQVAFMKRVRPLSLRCVRDVHLSVPPGSSERLVTMLFGMYIPSVPITVEIIADAGHSTFKYFGSRHSLEG